MHLRLAGLPRRCRNCLLGRLLATILLLLVAPLALAGERRTPLVVAVESARPSVVNIHGEKLIPAGEGYAVGDSRRKVNGMGTGVIIDERGYIITNHHVVDGVKAIMVTTSERETYVAKLVSHDQPTDLAIIKIDAKKSLPVIKIGTSSDLMPGETVVAVGNAFGYEHTVTRGIISALHRSVQVSDAQNYEDLIQTDASINPGNSGGPLLNIDGDMIGINVAVRAGAQGIGFAIPVDRAMTVATRLISVHELGKAWHGLVLEDDHGPTTLGVVLKKILPGSPGEVCGLKSGDIITAVGQRRLCRPIDLERALLDNKPGETVTVSVQREAETLSLDLVLAGVPATRNSIDDRIWEVLGLRLAPIPNRQFEQLRSRYRGGLTVGEVRPESPAYKQGIRSGDVLVGMHIWETVSVDNVKYVLDRPDFNNLAPLKFYILRGNETLYGHLTVSHRD